MSDHTLAIVLQVEGKKAHLSSRFNLQNQIIEIVEGPYWAVSHRIVDEDWAL